MNVWGLVVSFQQKGGYEAVPVWSRSNQCRAFLSAARPVTGTALPGPTWSVGKGTRATAKPFWEGSGGVPAFLARLTKEAGGGFARGRSDTSRLRARTAPARPHTEGGPPPLPPRLGLAHDRKCFGRASRSPQGFPLETRCLSPRERCSIPRAAAPGAWPAPCPALAFSMAPSPSDVYCSNCTEAAFSPGWQQEGGSGADRALTKMLLTGLYTELRETKIVISVWKMFKAPRFFYKSSGKSSESTS